MLANLVNLIDGMDALAAGIVAIAAVAFALLAVSFGRADAAALAAIVCGSTLAFLRRTTTRRRSSWATRGRSRSASCSPTLAVRAC